ncbi:MAG: hypothetical protein ACI86H_000593 [bacterium]|jgi:hypothetical protein
MKIRHRDKEGRFSLALDLSPDSQGLWIQAGDIHFLIAPDEIRFVKGMELYRLRLQKYEIRDLLASFHKYKHIETKRLEKKAKKLLHLNK